MLNVRVKDAVCPAGYPIPDMDTMGDRIRLLRRAKGLNQDQPAERCGVTKSAVSQWENNQTDNIKTVQLFKLLRTLGTDLAYLAFGEDRLPPDEIPPNRTSRKAI